MSSDAAHPTSVPVSHDAPPPHDASPLAAPVDPIDSLLHSILAGAQARVGSDLERAREAGLLDADGRVVEDRWPDDMKANSRTSVETG